MAFRPVSAMQARESTSGHTTDDGSSEQDKESSKALSLFKRPHEVTWYTRMASKDRVNWAKSPYTFIRFRSPVAIRLQLQCQAMSMFFPVNWNEELGPAFELMMANMADSPALAVSMDSASLLLVGQAGGDTRFVNAGMRLCGEALGLLRAEVGAVPSKRNDSAICGAITCLQGKPSYGIPCVLHEFANDLTVRQEISLLLDSYHLG
jgi:hypothetical protein